jgi:hypothetical protein
MFDLDERQAFMYETLCGMDSRLAVDTLLVWYGTERLNDNFARFLADEGLMDDLDEVMINRCFDEEGDEE